MTTNSKWQEVLNSLYQGEVSHDIVSHYVHLNVKKNHMEILTKEENLWFAEMLRLKCNCYI